MTGFSRLTGERLRVANKTNFVLRRPTLRQAQGERNLEKTVRAELVEAQC